MKKTALVFQKKHVITAFLELGLKFQYFCPILRSTPALKIL